MLQPYTPIYRQLVDRYKEDILSYRLQPGGRVDSIAEMRRRHGVARETAKRVLNILAEEGYIVQLPGKGSFVAERRAKQKVWGLVYPFYSIQYENLILQIASRAKERDRELRHFCDYNNYEEEIRLVAVMLRDRYEAVIVIPTLDESRTWAFYSRVSPLDSPVVLLDHTMTSNDFAFVVQSYDLGVVRALNYMLEQKVGGIAFVENEVWGGRNMVLELMRETHLELLRRKRPSFEPVVLPRASFVRADDLRRRGITGVFCCDDVSAVQTIGRLHEQGARVPGEFNVVSYGNTDLSRFFTPSITSVDPHNAEMATLVVELLCAMADEGRNERGQFVVHPELVIRET